MCLGTLLGVWFGRTIANTVSCCARAAEPEAEVLVTSGVQQGAWMVSGYGIAPAERASFTAPPATQSSGKKCYYVLDVLLCD